MTQASAEGLFSVDSSTWPLLRLSPETARAERPSASVFFDRLDRALDRSVPFLILLDARGVSHVDAAQREDLMRQLEARRTRIERQVLALAAICSSPLERGLVTAFTWVVKVPLPIRIVKSETEAEAWLLSHYAVIHGRAWQAAVQLASAP